MNPRKSPRISINPRMDLSPTRISIVGLFASLTVSLTGATGAPEKLLAFPPEIQLTTQRDRQSVIVQAVQPDGTTRDVTAQTKFTLENPALARLADATLDPVSDGQTQLAA